MKKLTIPEGPLSYRQLTRYSKQLRATFGPLLKGEDKKHFSRFDAINLIELYSDCKTDTQFQECFLRHGKKCPPANR